MHTAARRRLLIATLVIGGCVGTTKPAAPDANAAVRDATARVAAKPANDLIPRALLFGNPERTNAQISPDGKWVSWLAPHDGVLNVWVAPANELAKARAVTAAKQPIFLVHWAFDGKHLLYEQDANGDENFHVHRVALETGEDVDLTPGSDVLAGVLATSPRKPGTILVEQNDRDPALFDVHAIDLATGKRRLVAKNDQGFAEWVVDHDLNVRFGLEMKKDRTLLWMERRGNRWRRYDETPAHDVHSSGVLGFDATGRSYYAYDSRGRDTAALFLVDAKTRKKRLVHADARVDLGGFHHASLGHGARVLVHPTEMTVQAVVVDYHEPHWVVLDPRVEKDFEALAQLERGVPNVTSRTLDDATWIVAFESDARSTRHYRWDRRTQTGELLFAERPALDRHPLVPMHPVTIATRDGLSLVSYVSLPKRADPDGDGEADERVPMVLLVHGGPWVRDRWGFRAEHQLFADRGYAVLAVNFRGSAGFGKAFSHAADRQWGKKMHDDLLDAVKWAVDRGVTEADEVCIVGGSYGGYAALAGLTLTPDVFACGVAFAAPANLVTTFESFPPYWEPLIAEFYERVGDPRTPAGRQALLDVSPLTHVARISKPLLIGHGANDPRVKQAEPDRIVAAMEAKNIPVGYLVFPDEGHDLWRPANTQALYAVAEAFLSVHLGGSYQPIDDAELAASSMVVEAGRQWLPGLPENGSPP